MSMSYSRAWLLVDTMNRSFRRPPVATSRWRGEGAWLTPEGRTILRLYRDLEARSVLAGRTLLSELRRLLKPVRGGVARRGSARSRSRAGSYGTRIQARSLPPRPPTRTQRPGPVG